MVVKLRGEVQWLNNEKNWVRKIRRTPLKSYRLIDNHTFMIYDLYRQDTVYWVGTFLSVLPPLYKGAST